MGKNNLMFRLWYYFRQGWSIYFAFILAAINTLTVTYFLAIDNYPSLKSIFPSFEQYVVILVVIGVPLLVTVGYAHYKKTEGFKSEIDVIIESNPYQRRILVNTETALSLQLKLIIIIQTMAKNQEIDQNQLDEIQKLSDEISAFMNKRTFNSDDDLEYIFKICDFAFKNALESNSGIIGEDERTGELSCIDFNDIRGDKGLDINSKWFLDLVDKIEK